MIREWMTDDEKQEISQKVEALKKKLTENWEKYRDNYDAWDFHPGYMAQNMNEEEKYQLALSYMYFCVCREKYYLEQNAADEYTVNLLERVFDDLAEIWLEVDTRQKKI